MTVPARGTPVRAVLLDYGLTLVTHTRPVAALHRAYAQIAAGLPPRDGDRAWAAEELLAAVHDRVDRRVADNEMALEELDVVAAHREAYAELGLALDPEQIDEAMRLEQEAWWQGVQVADGTVATLATLRERGLRLGVCSNAAYRAASMRAQLDHVGLLSLVDAAVFSSELGWRKPSPHIFEAALATLHAEPATTVMVGDSGRADVGGAHGVGMRAIRLRQHRDDDDPEHPAEAVLDHLAGLPELLSAGIV